MPCSRSASGSAARTSPRRRAPRARPCARRARAHRARARAPEAFRSNSAFASAPARIALDARELALGDPVGGRQLAAIDCARRELPLSLASRTRARRSSTDSSPFAISAANSGSHASGVDRPVNHSGFAAPSATSPSRWRRNWIAWHASSASSLMPPARSPGANVAHCAARRPATSATRRAAARRAASPAWRVEERAHRRRLGAVERELELPVLDVGLEDVAVTARRKRVEPARVAALEGRLGGEEIGIGLRVRGGRGERRPTRPRQRRAKQLITMHCRGSRPCGQPADSVAHADTRRLRIRPQRARPGPNAAAARAVDIECTMLESTALRFARRSERSRRVERQGERCQRASPRRRWSAS